MEGLEPKVLIAILSVLSAIIGLLAAIVGRKKVIEIRHVTENSGSSYNTHEKWFDKTGWLIFWTIIFWPVGIYGIIRSRRVATGWKIVIIIFFLMVIGASQS